MRKRFVYACRAFTSILLNRDHAYVDNKIIHHHGGTVVVSTYITDLYDDLAEELGQETFLNEARKITIK